MSQTSLPPDSNLVRVSEKLEEVKGTVIQTIDNIMERGEKLEVLVDKTERLDTEAFRFNRNASRLRQRMLCKKIKIYAWSTLSIGVFIWLISSVACGFDYKECQ
jgi:vesicle-associated membrane protein 7